MQRLVVRLLAASGMSLMPGYAFAHVGAGVTSSFAAGFAHPFGGLDHMAAMVAVGLWAALKGGRALWAWPVAFVSVMLVGAMLGMAQMPVPFVEPGILASIVVLGLLVALAVDCPVWLGAAIVGLFAVFHGHAHGSEIPENASGLHYLAGFAAATATLHLVGLGIALALLRGQARVAIQVAGAACVIAGVVLGVGAW